MKTITKGCVVPIKVVTVNEIQSWQTNQLRCILILLVKSDTYMIQDTMNYS